MWNFLRRASCALMVAGLSACVASGGGVKSGEKDIPLTSAEITQLVSGNSLVRTDEAFIFTPEGNLVYVYRELGSHSSGKWFIKKASVDYKGGRVDDMLCVATNMTKKDAFKVLPCIRLFPDDEGRPGVFSGVSADCRNTDGDLTQCNFADRTFGFYVVRRKGLSTKAENANLVNNGDGTVSDRRTGLQWMQCAVGQKDYLMHACLTHPKKVVGGLAAVPGMVKAVNANRGYAGHSDWRLPTLEELKTLVVCSNGKPTPLKDGERCDYPLPSGVSAKFAKPTFDPVFYGNPEAYLTKSVGEGGTIGIVDFSGGHSIYFDTAMLARETAQGPGGTYIRLVRKSKAP